MPKKEKKGKAEKMVRKAGKDVDRGLHKGWDVAKSAGKGLEEAATRKEEHKEEKKEE